MNADQPRLLSALDVEGTVAPLTLTTAQLFPYARKHFGEFLREHLGDSDVQADLKLLAEENRSETDESYPKFSARKLPAPIRRSPICSG